MPHHALCSSDLLTVFNPCPLEILSPAGLGETNVYCLVFAVFPNTKRYPLTHLFCTRGADMSLTVVVMREECPCATAYPWSRWRWLISSAVIRAMMDSRHHGEKFKLTCFSLLTHYINFDSLQPSPPLLSVFSSVLFPHHICGIYTWAGLWSRAYLLTLSHYDNNITFLCPPALLFFFFFPCVRLKLLHDCEHIFASLLFITTCVSLIFFSNKKDTVWNTYLYNKW